MQKVEEAKALKEGFSRELVNDGWRSEGSKQVSGGILLPLGPLKENEKQRNDSAPSNHGGKRPVMKTVADGTQRHAPPPLPPKKGRVREQEERKRCERCANYADS